VSVLVLALKYGPAVFVGAVPPPPLGVTAAVSAALADADPAVFVAVTTTSIRSPTSDAFTLYVLPVAPEMLVQLVAQSCH
jgi:hypothetical protein